MAHHSLSERQEQCESDYNYKILNQLPVIIRCTIKNYKRLVQRLEKPFCVQLSDVISQTMLYAITNIPDAIFGYHHNDEITFILKNNKDAYPWHNNNIQKISSNVSSYVTLGFYKSAELFSDNLDLVGDAVFDVKTFAVPTVMEAFNNLIWRQGYCMKEAINQASYIELSDKLGVGPASSLLKNTGFKEKAEILLQHCGKDIREDYPIPFLRGVGVYKVPVIVTTRTGTANRNRWYVDKDLSNFVEDKDFILNILNTGLDIYRGPDI